MGRQSTRANKNIYQICREECELTRERASEMMTDVSASRIEKSNTIFRIRHLMTLFRWLTVINDRISAIIIVPTNVKLAIAMYLKSKCPNFQASFWKQ